MGAKRVGKQEWQESVSPQGSSLGIHLLPNIPQHFNKNPACQTTWTTNSRESQVGPHFEEPRYLNHGPPRASFDLLVGPLDGLALCTMFFLKN